MRCKNHFIFCVFFIIVFKKLFTNLLITIDWWHIIPAGLITCLLPDLDHPRSFYGNKLKFISKFIYSNIGHRKITHSLLFFIILNLLIFILNLFIKSNLDIVYGMILGYLSHIVADINTPMGVYLFWPFSTFKVRSPLFFLFKKKNFESFFCFFLFFLSLLMYNFNKIKILIKNFL